MGGVCSGFAWRKRRSLERLSPGDARQLMRELAGEPHHSEELDDGRRRFLVSELNLRLADVAFELSMLPAAFVALTRISLASGVGLSVSCALSGFDGSPTERAFRVAATASGGVLGAMGAAWFGRLAKSRSAEIREQWDGSSRVIGKTLGTTLAAPSSKPS